MKWVNDFHHPHLSSQIAHAAVSVTTANPFFNYRGVHFSFLTLGIIKVHAMPDFLFSEHTVQEGTLIGTAFGTYFGY